MKRRRRLRTVEGAYADMADRSFGEPARSAVVWHQSARDWWFVVYVGTFAECLLFCEQAGPDFNVVNGRRGVELDVYKLLAALPRVPADSGGLLWRSF